MKTSSLFNDNFNAHFTNAFPNAKSWLETETTDAVDVEAAAKAAGLLIHKASFTELAKSDLRFGRRQDDGAYLDHDVLYINTDHDNAHQRWEIAHALGQIMVQQSYQECDKSETVVTEFNELGQEQSLPQPVYDFFVGHHFEPMRENALANMSQTLDRTNIPEVKDWWHQSNSEARLANAYLYGFIPEAKSQRAIHRLAMISFLTTATINLLSSNDFKITIMFDSTDTDDHLFEINVSEELFDSVPKDLFTGYSSDDIQIIADSLKATQLADITLTDDSDTHRTLEIKVND